MEVEGYTNYLIFEDGSCWSKPRYVSNMKDSPTCVVKKQGNWLKPRQRRGGYLAYVLYNEGACKAFSVHRLVALAYLSNPENYRVVNHRDGNTTNNQKDNLEWCSDLYNGQSVNKHGSRKGTIAIYHGTKGDTFTGKIRHYGKYFYTKTCKTRAAAENLLSELVSSLAI